MLEKIKQTAIYIFFGILSIGVNTESYALAYNTLHMNNIISTAISWFVSILFMYITTKLFVFDSKAFIELYYLKNYLIILVLEW